jgi:polysaccharide export outer membrane protein
MPGTLLVLLLLGLLLPAATGCRVVGPPKAAGAVEVPPEGYVPRELSKVSLPSYIIEPPDILLIDAVKVVPKSPYRIEPLDILFILAPPESTLPDAPIAANYPVEPGGLVNLGPQYGSVQVAGLTLSEATQAIVQHLSALIRSPQVSVQLAQSAGEQQIQGEALVGPDGSVILGTYGSVYVAGMTLAEAKLAIEDHLSQFLEQPEVSVDVFAYNSKVYYVISEGAGQGPDAVAVLPITGNETVLDAVGQIGGVTQVADKTRIWIARPAPDGVGGDQILPVDWASITRGADTRTNYQILPGDRILIGGDPMVAFASWVDKVVTPFERAFGFALLGSQTVQTIARFPRGFRQGTALF